MTNAALRGKPDAGNPHVRFDEGEVASAKPRRGSLLYNIKRLLGSVVAVMFSCVAGAADVYVDINDPYASDEPGEGRGSAALPYQSIQAAVEAAEADGSGYDFDSGDVIWVKPGRYDQGGYVDGNGLTNRVRITKKLYLRATGDRSNTFIVGAYDPTGTCNCGPAAVRCVDASASGAAGTIIRGFTITEGAVLSSSNGNTTTQNCAGGVYASSADLWIVECTISKCRAGRYAALHRGTCVRSLLTLNAANYAWGACSRHTRYLNCVIFANGIASYTSNTPVEDGSLVNCSLIDNCLNGVAQTAAYNTIIASSSGSGNDNKLPTTYSNLVWTAEHGNRQVMSTATGDFRLLSTSAAVNAGDPALLTNITLPSTISDLQYVDYLGNDIPQTGTINCGAVQEVATPVCGSIQCDFAAVSDGAEYTIGSGAYAYFDTYPTQIVVKPVLSSSQTLYGLRHEPRLGNVDAIYPDMQNRFALMPDPSTGTNDVYTALRAGTTCWVATNGNDSAAGTESNPLRTLQAASDNVAPTQRSVIFVKEGVYDEGTDSSGNYRLSLPTERYCFIRAVDGPEKTVIRGGVGVGCCNIPYLGALQGFTLTGADTSAKPSVSAAFHGNHPLSTLLDCIITNNVAASNGGVCNVGTLQRCVIGENTGDYLCYNECLSSCAAYGNTASVMLFDNSCSLYQCTVAGNTGTHFNGATIVNSVLDGGDSAAFGSATASSAGNVAYGFTSLPESGFVAADPIVVDAAHGDLRTALGSPAATCGEPPTASNYAGVYKRGWTIFSTSTIEGGKLVFSKSGVPEAGAYQHDHPRVAREGLLLIFR